MPKETWFSVAEFAKYKGISSRTAYNWIKENKVISDKRDGKLRIRWDGELQKKEPQERNRTHGARAEYFSLKDIGEILETEGVLSPREIEVKLLRWRINKAVEAEQNGDIDFDVSHNLLMDLFTKLCSFYNAVNNSKIAEDAQRTTVIIPWEMQEKPLEEWTEQEKALLSPDLTGEEKALMEKILADK